MYNNDSTSQARCSAIWHFSAFEAYCIYADESFVHTATPLQQAMQCDLVVSRQHHRDRTIAVANAPKDAETRVRCYTPTVCLGQHLRLSSV